MVRCVFGFPLPNSAPNAQGGIVMNRFAAGAAIIVVLSYSLPVAGFSLPDRDKPFHVKEAAGLGTGIQVIQTEDNWSRLGYLDDTWGRDFGFTAKRAASGIIPFSDPKQSVEPQSKTLAQTTPNVFDPASSSEEFAGKMAGYSNLVGQGRTAAIKELELLYRTKRSPSGSAQPPREGTATLNSMLAACSTGGSA